MPGQLEEETRQDRKDELMALFQEQGEAWAEGQVGRDISVMVDRMDGEDAIARTEFDALDIDGTVRILATRLAPGTLQRVRVLATEGPMDLLATPSAEAADGLLLTGDLAADAMIRAKMGAKVPTSQSVRPDWRS